MLKRLFQKEFVKEVLGIKISIILFFVACVIRDYSIELRQYHTTIFGDLMALLAFFLIFTCGIIFIYTICSIGEIIIDKKIKKRK